MSPEQRPVILQSSRFIRMLVLTWKFTVGSAHTPVMQGDGTVAEWLC
jgi:hypothetical protein